MYKVFITQKKHKKNIKFLLHRKNDFSVESKNLNTDLKIILLNHKNN